MPSRSRWKNTNHRRLWRAQMRAIREAWEVNQVIKDRVRKEVSGPEEVGPEFERRKKKPVIHQIYELTEETLRKYGFELSPEDCVLRERALFFYEHKRLPREEAEFEEWKYKRKQEAAQNKRPRGGQPVSSSSRGADPGVVAANTPAEVRGLKYGLIRPSWDTNKRPPLAHGPGFAPPPKGWTKQDYVDGNPSLFDPDRVLVDWRARAIHRRHFTIQDDKAVLTGKAYQQHPAWGWPLSLVTPDMVRPSSGGTNNCVSNFENRTHTLPKQLG